MTLFRAVEAGKSRSIDQVIRKISKVLPEEDIKKTELTSAPVKQIHAVVSEPAFELSKNEPTEIQSVNPSKNEDLSSQGEPPINLMKQEMMFQLNLKMRSMSNNLIPMLM